MKNTMENKMNHAADEHLSEHFTLGEMVRSGTAIRLGIGNEPDGEAVENLRHLCSEVLEPLRRRYGRIIITSGFRCERLNEAVGGAKGSQHLRGEAADIHVTCTEMCNRYAEFIRQNTDFDQLICEPIGAKGKRWLHVSFTRCRANRHEVIR